MKEKKKKQIHPIIERILLLAHKGFDQVEFDNYAVEQIQDMLSECYGKEELVHAVKDLLTFACYLDTEVGCHSASMKILKVVESSTEALQALGKIDWEDNER
jgi:hypothetical protein